MFDERIQNCRQVFETGVKAELVDWSFCSKVEVVINHQSLALGIMHCEPASVAENPGECFGKGQTPHVNFHISVIYATEHEYGCQRRSFKSGLGFHSVSSSG